MLKEKQANLPARLLCTTALVAASLAYGYWQDFVVAPPRLALNLPRPATPKPVAVPSRPAPAAMPTAPTEASTPSPAVAAAAPEPRAMVQSAPEQAAPPAQKSASIAPATPIPAPSASSPAPSASTVAPPTPAPPSQSALLAAAPAAAPSGPTVAMQPGTHLEDGEFISEEENFEWGTVQVKLQIHAGAITNVAILQIPDHRSRSVELSEASAPILISETIKNQKSQVDTVSEATYTSMAYQDAVANALMKATH